jgi:para-nitrobenzyl esterase
MRRKLSIPHRNRGPERKARHWLIAALAMGLLPFADAGRASPADDALVQTESGIVRGIVGQDYRSFQGVPYAAAPVGDLRWRPPQPAVPWGAARDASEPGTPCPQIDPRGGALLGSEDCLYLNVTTPYGPHADRPLPVMVWIHGGGFASGSGGAYNGRNLAIKGNVVLVTFNYRLGPFGFLAHLSLDAESPSGLSGNFGLADQEAALRWVRRNIAAFGGDPSNVTIFGEEAGATSICAHLVSPTAAGLFQRAILQNGACLGLLPRLDAAQNRGAALAESLGCGDLKAAPSCLRSRSAAELLKASAAPPKSGEPGAASGPSWGPIVGAAGLPQQPADGFASGAFLKVSLMTGSARGNAAAVKGSAGDSACPILALEGLAARKTDLYAYEFVPGGSELRYLFAIGGDGVGEPDNLPPSSQGLADQMVGFWSEFAHKGDPNGPGLPPWPKFHAPADVLALAPMPEGSHPVPFDREHRCGAGVAASGKPAPQALSQPGPPQ